MVNMRQINADLITGAGCYITLKFTSQENTNNESE